MLAALPSSAPRRDRRSTSALTPPPSGVPIASSTSTARACSQFFRAQLRQRHAIQQFLDAALCLHVLSLGEGGVQLGFGGGTDFAGWRWRRVRVGNVLLPRSWIHCGIVLSPLSGFVAGARRSLNCLTAWPGCCANLIMC